MQRNYLSKVVLGKMMIGWVPNFQKAINKTLEKIKPNKIGVLPNAVNIIPRIIKGDVSNED